MIDQERTSLKPIEGANRSLRRRLDLKGEFMLALLPTITSLIVLAIVELYSQQRLLFASLASSAFLIYLDPHHGANSVRTLVISQMTAAIVGFAAFFVFGPGYFTAGGAMVVTIVIMILCNAVHPPAVSTALGFAFRASSENNLILFGMAVGMVATLVLLARASLWIMARYTSRQAA